MFRTIVLLICLLVLPISGFAAKNVSFGALTGGTTDALDAIPVNDVNNDGVETDPLETGDRAFGTDDDQFYSYVYDASSTASEDSPEVIVPDDREGGTGAWHRRYADDISVGSIDFSYGSDYSDYLDPGRVALFEFPWDCTITGVKLFAGQQGSAVVDLWVASEADYPPTSEDSITGDATPQLSNEYLYTDTTLTGWTTEISEGDYCIFNINSISGIKMFTISLDIERSR